MSKTVEEVASMTDKEGNSERYFLIWANKFWLRDFLVAQWLGLCLPMHGFSPWLGV